MPTNVTTQVSTNSENFTHTTSFATLSHTFRDPWENAEVEVAFRFAKPTKAQIKRLQDVAPKNPTQASRNLLLDTVHTDDKEALEQAMDKYPGVATTFSTAMIKAVGISSELGN